MRSVFDTEGFDIGDETLSTMKFGLSAFLAVILAHMLIGEFAMGFRPAMQSPRLRLNRLAAVIKKGADVEPSLEGKMGHEKEDTPPVSALHGGSKSGHEEHLGHASNASSLPSAHDDFNITYLDVSKMSPSPLDSVKKSVKSVPGLGLGQSQRSLSESLTIPNKKSAGGGGSFKVPKSLASLSVNVKSSDPVVSQIQETRARIEDLKRQVQNMEKILLSGNASNSASASAIRDAELQKQEKRVERASSELDAFMTSLKMEKISLSKVNVQRCAVFASFVVGCAIMASVYHRLWLLGGIIAAWWSADAVHRDNRVGQLVRRVGVQLTQFIRDRQEQWNYVVIYYETGRLAYASRKRWEKIDKKYNIDERFTAFKKLAMKRASQLNSEAGLRATLNDLWDSTREVRENVNKLDKKYSLSKNIRDFTRGLYLITNQSVGSWLDEVRRVGSSVSGGKIGAPVKKGPRYSSGAQINPWFPTWLLGPQSQYNPKYRQSRLRKATSRDKGLRRDRERLQELQRLKRERRERELERQRYSNLEKELRYSGFTPPGSGGFLKGIKEFFGQEPI